MKTYGSLFFLISTYTSIKRFDKDSDIRQAMSNYYGNECFYCGCEMLLNSGIPNRDNTLTIEHIIPSSYGGENDLENYLISCKKCNNERDRIPFYSYLSSILADSQKEQLGQFCERLEKYEILCRELAKEKEIIPQIGKVFFEDNYRIESGVVASNIGKFFPKFQYLEGCIFCGTETTTFGFIEQDKDNKEVNYWNVMFICQDCQNDRGDIDFLTYAGKVIAKDDIGSQKRFCNYYEKNEILCLEKDFYYSGENKRNVVLLHEKDTSKGRKKLRKLNNFQAL